MEDQVKWEKIASLFDRLLRDSDPASVLASEPDIDVRFGAEDLWSHHLQASRANFLAASPEFGLLPVLEPGQILLGRFRIEKMIGRGGMGEVYLAHDSRMEERVALKTIARLLAPSPPIRRRILAEVQNARRVTHPNVCRIHDLFEDGETVFFTMELVEGSLLSDLLETPIPRADARLLAWQLAEGLHGAHRTGVVHGDFKPANVIIQPGGPPRAVIMDFGLARAADGSASEATSNLSVQAGTAEFMAPELVDGAPPSIRSDIYAFGKLARQVLGDHAICDWCTQELPDKRPTTLAPVIRKLAPANKVSRRWWLGGAAVAAAGALTYPHWRGRLPVIYLPPGARVLVNGFHCIAESLHPARLARAMMLTALNQSPRIRTIVDQDLLRELARLDPTARLPLGGTVLEQIIGKLRASILIEAELTQHSDRYSLRLQVLRAAPRQLLADQAFHDLPGVSAVARQAAAWLRNAAGESKNSLALNPVAVESFTSAVPEALDKYYSAMEHWAFAETDLATPLLEEAVRLDPNFAQAHCILGMILNITGQNERAYFELDRARQLSPALPDRERNEIETNYAALTEDWTAALLHAYRNVDLYPDEPRVYRWLARVLCRTGSATEAVSYNRKAVELSSNDELQISELINNLCEANQFGQAVSEFEDLQRKGIHNRWLYGSGGLAYLGAERYNTALAAYMNEPGGDSQTLDQLRAKVLRGDLEGSSAIAKQVLLSAQTPVDKYHAAEMLCGLRYVTDRLSEARACLADMLDLPVYPQSSRRFDCVVFWAGRLTDRTALTEARKRLEEILRRWPSRSAQGFVQHARGMEAWLDGSVQDAENKILEAVGSAFSPHGLFDLATLHAAQGKTAAAEDDFERFDRHRGTILSFWFTGILVLAQLQRAEIAKSRGDRGAARRFSQKVLDHWSASNPGLRMVQAAGNIHRDTTSF